MNKLFKFPCLTIILFLIGISVYGQNINFEKAFLQTDRDIYIAGENVFFKLYLFDGKTFIPKIKSNTAYLTLRNEQSTNILDIQLKTQNSMAYGSIYLPDTLSTGRYQFVLFTNCMRNNGEKTFFTKEILVANRFDNELNKIISHSVSVNLLSKPEKSTMHYTQNKPLINLTPDKNSYSKREKLMIGFDISGISADSTNQLSETEKSTKHYAQNKPLINITPEKSNYSKREKIRIGFDISGISAESVANLSISISEATHNLNKQLILPDYLANSTIPNSTFPQDFKCNYYPETDGVIIQGRIFNLENQQSTENSIVFLSSQDTVANLQIARTDFSGMFSFKLPECYNGKDLILRLPYNQKTKIEIDNKFDLKAPFKPSLQFLDSGLIAYLHKSQNIVHIQKIYQTEIKGDVTINEINKELPSLIFSPGQNFVFPADFVKLPDFVEISREILPFLKIRQHENKYVANILNEKEKQFFDHPPIIFLDGVPIDDINQIIKLNTEKIKKIETIGRERYYGGLYFPGILAIYSYKMEINNIVWQTPTLSMKLDSPYPASTLINPDYSKSNKNSKYTPDVRQLLDWEPDITLHAGEKKYIEFFASDNPGEFDIKVEGITTDGAPFSGKATIKITSNSR